LFSIAPVRVALYPHPVSTKVSRSYTTTFARPAGDQTHNSDYALRALDALGILGVEGKMSLPIDAERSARVMAQLTAELPADQGRPLIVLHPGTSQETKCWPPSYFSRLIDRLSSRARIVITGSPAEVGLGQEIVSGVKIGRQEVWNAAGKFSHILDTAMLVRQAALVVTGDTSVLHIASAYDIPIVGIYGGTRPGRNGGRSKHVIALFNDAVPCAPCYLAQCKLAEPEQLRCLSSVEVDQVFVAVDALLRSPINMMGAEAA